MIITHASLNMLGDTQFERMVKALLTKIIGHGITPFAHGKDGAREAIYFGKANYPSPVEQWEGHWVFQVKFSDVSLGIDKARATVKYVIDEELKKLTEYKYFQNQTCDNYILITNVPFSGESEKGLHDYIKRKKEQYKVKNFGYWDGEKVATFLNVTPQVKETFFPMLGFKQIKSEELDFLRSVYVKPKQYEQLKAELLEKKL